MKKLITIACAVVLAMACIFTSCSNTVPGYDAKIDTVISLAAPKVTAKAYPGVNIVSWLPVPSASEYELRIYENDVQVQSNVPFAADSDLIYEDVVGEINNGITRKYVVVAISKSDPGRSVYAANSIGEASCKCIMPPAKTLSLELPAYENGYDGTVKTVSESDKYVVSPSNISLGLDSFGILSIQFPVKAYLKYVYYVNKGNLFETTNAFSTTDTVIDEYSNNVIYSLSSLITSAGTYRVAIGAFSRNECYGVSPIVQSEQSVEVPSLGVKAGTFTSVSWANNGKTARVIWEPSTFTDGTIVPASYYTVYRAVKGTEEYTKVKTAVESINNEKVYFVDDQVADNTKNYKYIVVCTDGTSYAEDYLTGDLDKYTQKACTIEKITAASSSYDTTDNNVNDFITWTITLDDVATDDPKCTATEIKGVYLLEKEADWTGTVYAADFDMTKPLTYSSTDNENGKEFKVYTDNVAIGKAYLLVVAGAEDLADGYLISEAYEVKLAAINGDNLNVVASTIDNSINNASTGTPVLNDIIVALSDVIPAGTDSVNNYTYTLYKAVATTAVDIAAGKVTFTSTTDWTKVQDVTMARNNDYDPDASSLYYEASYSMTNVDNGVYYFKLVKADKAGNIVYTRDSTTVNTTTAIAYTPVISADWDNPAVASGNITVQFTKNNTTNSTTEETHNAETHVVAYKSETVEPGITYQLYRATLVDDATTVVFTKVANVTGTTNNLADATVYYWEDDTWKTNADYQYVNSIKYSYSETVALSTGSSYQYVVVATRADGAYVVSNIVTVAGAN